MLNVKNISYNIDGVKLLENIVLNSGKGEIVTLIGPNGSGKTTLFNVINGFLKPSNGKITLDGNNISSIIAYQRALSGIGRLWQDVRLFNKLSALENLLISVQNIQGEKILDNIFKRKIVKQSTNEKTYIAEQYLRNVDLYEKRHLEVENLSFGQQKLVALGRLFMNDSKLLLLDEPFGGVNVVIIERIKSLICELRNAKKSILIIEHNIAKVKEISDKMYALDKGKIINSGLPDEVVNSKELKNAYSGV